MHRAVGAREVELHPRLLRVPEVERQIAGDREPVGGDARHPPPRPARCPWASPGSSAGGRAGCRSRRAHRGSGGASRWWAGRRPAPRSGPASPSTRITSPARRALDPVRRAVVVGPAGEAEQPAILPQLAVGVAVAVEGDEGELDLELDVDVDAQPPAVPGETQAYGDRSASRCGRPRTPGWRHRPEGHGLVPGTAWRGRSRRGYGDRA